VNSLAPLDQGLRIERSGCRIRVCARGRRGASAGRSTHVPQRAPAPHKPLQSSVESASFTKHAAHWTLAVLSFAALIIVLDNTLLNGALLSLPGQLGAEDSMLQWFDRAKGVAGWTAAASEAMGVGPLAGGLLFVVSIGRRSF
jgi:hypothetical protein